MEKFVKKVLFFILFIIAIISPAYLVDPYNVFHWDNIRDNGVDPNRNYIKMKYILSEPNKYDSFIFGSSRVGAIHPEKIDTGKVYNMTYSNGLPAEHLDNIKTFIDNGVRIRTIYMGVDNASYNENKINHKGTPQRASYEELQNIDTFFLTYFNPKTTLKSIPYILGPSQGMDIDAFYDYGWWFDYDLKKEWGDENPRSIPVNFMDETLADIRDIVELCNKNGIDLIVFTNPMYEKTYNAALGEDYIQFLIQLAQITDYYNFSGINDITINTENYIDSSHYSAYVGDMIINVIVYGEIYEELYEQGFGWYVTHDNVEELINVLDKNN